MTALADHDIEIGTVTISPAPVIVNEPMTITVQFYNDNGHHGEKYWDDVHYAGEKIEVKIIHADHTSILETTIENNGVAHFEYTPPHVGSYEYHFLNVEGSGELKNGLFDVEYGMALAPKSTLPTDIDGNFIALNDGFSKVIIYAAALQDSGLIDMDTDYSIKVDGQPVSFVKDKNGKAFFTIGPLHDGDDSIVEIQAGATDFDPKTIHVRFIKGSISVDTNASVDDQKLHANPESMIKITASLKDNGNPLVGVPIIIKELTSDGNIITDRMYTTVDGEIIINCTLGKTAGNNIFLVQLQNLSLLKAVNVRSDTCDLADFKVSALPGNEVPADGVTQPKIIVQITDKYGNNIKGSSGVEVTVKDEYGNIRTAQPNSNGVAYVWCDPSEYPGSLVNNVTVTAGDWTLSKEFIINFVVAEPSMMKLSAYPEVIASSNVENKNVTYAMNNTTIVARVLDQYGNPRALQPFTLTVDPAMGKIFPSTGVTDANGEVRAVFNLSSKVTGKGSVYVYGSSNDIQADPIEIKYTDQAHFNISTNVTPRRVSVGDTVDVTLDVDGVGWEAGRAPADVMLVMDRSGSMGDAIGFTGYAADDNGGWFGPMVYDSASDPIARNTIRNLEYTHDRETRLIYKVSQSLPQFPGNSQFIIDDIPTTMVSGQTYTVHVTFKNTGDLAWNETPAKIRLAGASSGEKFLNYTSGTYNRALMEPGTVNKDGTYTFTFNMKAPTVYKSTTYTNLYYRMYCEYPGAAQWFGAYDYKTITVIPDESVPVPNAEFVSSTIPDNMITGQYYDVQVTFKNIGNVDWKAGTRLAYNLGNDGYFWMANNPANFNPINVFAIPADVTVHHDDTYTFSFTMRGPYVYNTRNIGSVQFQMTSDTYGNFGEISPAKTIRVTPDAAAYPNAELVSYNIPETMITGQAYTCSITLRNTGGLPWVRSSSGTNMNGTKLYFSGDSSTFGISGNRDIPSTNGVIVNNGDTVTYTFTLTAPVITGTRDYTNFWFMPYMDYLYGQYPAASNNFFGPSYPLYKVPKITVVPVPRANTLYGDWYSYQLYNPDGSKNGGVTYAATDLASPIYNAANGVKVINGYIPVTNSNGAGLTSNSFAPTGTYTLQMKNSYYNGLDATYKVWIWDNMKMGQIADQDAMAKVAAKMFIDPASEPRYIWPQDRVGLVTFGTDAGISGAPDKDLLSMSSPANVASLQQAISDINSYGDTNSADALMLAIDEMVEKPNSDPEATRNIIFLTDGYSTSTDAANNLQVDRIVDEKIVVYAIGVADDHTKVDEEFLQTMADRSGGKYYFVSDMDELIEAFGDIGHQIDKKVTKESYINVTLEQDAMGVDNVTYVTGSAYTMMNNDSSTLQQVEPYVDGHTLGWVIEPMDLNRGHNWTLTYKVTTNNYGLLRPMADGTHGHFAFDDRTDVIEFNSSAIYVNDNGLSTGDMMGLEITRPVETEDDPAEIVDSTIDLRWDISYNAQPLMYTQIIEYAPAGSTDFEQLASGFEYNQPSGFRYLVDLNKQSIKPGLYTFRVYATNGLFEAVDEVDLDIKYEHGPLDSNIIIDSK